MISLENTWRETKQNKTSQRQNKNNNDNSKSKPSYTKQFQPQYPPGFRSEISWHFRARKVFFKYFAMDFW